MDYLKAFIIGGIFCIIGQILIDKTKLTPARILVGYVVAGVILGGIGIYKPFIEFHAAKLLGNIIDYCIELIIGISTIKYRTNAVIAM